MSLVSSFLGHSVFISNFWTTRTLMMYVVVMLQHWKQFTDYSVISTVFDIHVYFKPFLGLHVFHAYHCEWLIGPFVQ